MDRRKFIKYAGSTLASSSLYSMFNNSTLFADELTKPHFFIHLHAQGGLDGPLGLNPMLIDDLKKRRIKEDEFHFVYRDSDIIQGNGKSKSVLLGKSAAPLLPHLDDMAIINGVLMNYELSAHPGNINYAISGSTERDATTFAIQLAQEKNDSPLGVGYSRFNYSIHPGSFGGNVFPLENLTTSNTLNNQDTQKRIQFLEAIRRTQKLTASQGLVLSSSNYSDIGPLIEQFKEKFPGFKKIMNQAHCAAAGFLTQGLKYAHIDISCEFGAFGPGYVDTHYDHNEHHGLAIQIFQIAADIMSMFKKIEFGDSSLFDHTTFLFTTEFGRTPYKEGSKGSDHNPRHSSFFVAGKGVNGGQTIGNSYLWSNSQTEENRSRLQALPFDYDRGSHITAEQMLAGLDGNLIKYAIEREQHNFIDYIFPENVLHTVANIFGLPLGTPLVNNARPIKQIIA